MIFGNDTAKVEPQSCSLFFPGSFITDPVKPGEDFFLFLISDTWSFIPDLQFDTRTVFTEKSGDSGIFGGILDGIFNQVID
jgi:hypothetical protein